MTEDTGAPEGREHEVPYYNLCVSLFPRYDKLDEEKYQYLNKLSEHVRLCFPVS